MQEKNLWQHFIETYTKNYINFRGRARRKEYWSFILFLNVIYITLSMLSAVSEYIIFAGLFLVLGSLIPLFAITARRNHDTGKSGWFMLVPIYSFILTVLEGDNFTNKYGHDPKNLDAGNEIDSIGSE